MVLKRPSTKQVCSSLRVFQRSVNPDRNASVNETFSFLLWWRSGVQLFETRNGSKSFRTNKILSFVSTRNLETTFRFVSFRKIFPVWHFVSHRFDCLCKLYISFVSFRSQKTVSNKWYTHDATNLGWIHHGYKYCISVYIDAQAGERTRDLWHCNLITPIAEALCRYWCWLCTE